MTKGGGIDRNGGDIGQDVDSRAQAVLSETGRFGRPHLFAPDQLHRPAKYGECPYCGIFLP